MRGRHSREQDMSCLITTCQSRLSLRQGSSSKRAGDSEWHWLLGVTGAKDGAGAAGDWQGQVF